MEDVQCYTVYNVQIMENVQCKIYNGVQCTIKMYNVQCTMLNVQCRIYTMSKVFIMKNVECRI